MKLLLVGGAGACALLALGPASTPTFTRAELLRPGPAADQPAANAGSSSDMELIPTGTYEPFYKRAGAPLKVKEFLLDRAPATRAEFLQFVERRPRWRRSALKPLFAEASYPSDWICLTKVGQARGQRVKISATIWK